MKQVFVVVNGDSVGSKIGEKIQANDREGLKKISGSIKDAHTSIDKWVESKGGEIITSTGDEGLYHFPEESLGELEALRNQYQQQSGTTLTIGIGNSISEAFKALIYGKMQNKDQVNQYKPEMDDSISQDVENEGDPEDDAVNQESQENELPTSESVIGDKNKQIEEEQQGTKEDGDLTEQKPPVAQNKDQEGEGLPPEISNKSDGSDKIDSFNEDKGNTQQEGGEKEPGNSEQQEENVEDRNIEDVENKYSKDKETAQIEGEVPKEDSEGGEEIPGSEETGNESENTDDGNIPELGEDEIAGDDSWNDNQEEHPGSEEDGQKDPNGLMTNMIYGQMEGEGEENEQEKLRSNIADVLLVFKENKETLEMFKEQNPKLYQATLAMLRSMIEMAKKLNMNPMEDAQDSINQQESENQLPNAEDMGEREPEQEEGEEQAPPVSQEPPKAGEEDFEEDTTNFGKKKQ